MFWLFQATAVPYEVMNSWKPFAAADPEFYERRAASLAAVKAKIEAEHAAACTFAPQLMASPARAAPGSAGKGRRPTSAE